MPRKIDISHKTIIFITVFLLGLWIVYLIRDLLILLFIAVILMSALAPVVSFFTKLKFPKALGILITYIIIIAAFGGILLGFLPLLVEQSNKLIDTFPTLLVQYFNINNIDQTFLQSQVADLSKNLLSFTLVVFDNIITILFLLVLTFYLLLERENLEKRTAALFLHRQHQIQNLTIKIEERLGAWVRGQLFLSLIIGVLVYIGLFLLNIPYALTLAIVAGILEIVPVIGPIVAAIPGILLAFTISPILALGVAVMYFVIQQLENHLIVPQVMGRAVGLNPLVVILAIAVGSRLLGIVGALLAVPLTVVLQIIVSEMLLEKEKP
ncbi:MAG: AI-2E family transporter [Candidatus Daviesbacteria bacterium]|nr:MAG: AI-2E family transporter [Candidatus Daviesbacteria bacterium]